jgi:hypothetical protein
MPLPIRLCGVTVNHNTSAFVELLLRTLFLTNDLTGVSFSMTVLDNQSDDPQRDDLCAFLHERGVAFVQTGFDTGIAAAKHGEALAGFVHRHPDCTHFLFLDADMWFVEPETVPTMLAELAAAPATTFGVQARIRGYYAGRVIEGRDGIAGASDAVEQPPQLVTIDGRAYAETVMPRCSPVCSLVANTPLFRTVVDAVGLAPARRLGVDTIAFYDTFGLMTAVLRTHHQDFIVSRRTVNHFTQTAYVPEHRGGKDRDCLTLLGDLRAGLGMGRPIFVESEWARQQRRRG